MVTAAITLNFGELAGPGPYSGGGSDNESTGGGGSGGGSGGGGSNPAVSAASAAVSAADQVKSLMELQQQHQLPGSYGLYRPPYNNPGSGGHDGFPGNRAGHLGGYPFATMPGQNSYTGYHHLGYPSSQSPGNDGKT